MEENKQNKENLVNQEEKTNFNNENYLVFKTKDDFHNHVNKYTIDYEEKINKLEAENKELKIKDVEIKKLNRKLNVFTDHILEKYDVKDMKIDNDKFDYSNYDNLEKSIIKILEEKKINYKKSDQKEEKETKNEIPKIYL